MVDPGEAEILERFSTQHLNELILSLLHGCAAVFHTLQDGSNLLLIHSVVLGVVRSDWMV